MKKHTHAYMKAYGYREGDFIPCEVCGCTCNDVHHIVKRAQGGTDHADNLIGLCRRCHNKAHGLIAPTLTIDKLIKFKNDFNKHNRGFIS